MGKSQDVCKMTRVSYGLQECRTLHYATKRRSLEPIPSRAEEWAKDPAVICPMIGWEGCGPGLLLVEAKIYETQAIYPMLITPTKTTEGRRIRQGGGRAAEGRKAGGEERDNVIILRIKRTRKVTHSGKREKCSWKRGE